MSSSILESQRSAFEELERIEQAIADRIARNPGVLPESVSLSSSSSLHGQKKRPFKETVLQQQEIARFIKRYKDQAEFLTKCFDTKEEHNAQHPATLRKKEIESISSADGSLSETVDSFYGQLTKVRDFHRKYPEEPVEDLAGLYEMGLVRRKRQKQLQLESGELAEEESIEASTGVKVLLSAAAIDLDIETMYSGEELFGKYLDLVSYHERFINLKYLNGSAHQQMSYLVYLEKFADFNDASLYPFGSRVRDPEYFQYISELHIYLTSFLTRSRPLDHTDVVLQKIENDFQNSWDKKLKFPGWSFESNIEHKSVKDGVETPDGYYCTPCAKYFAKQTVYTAHLSGKKHKKNSESTIGTEDKGANEQKKLLAYHEYSVNALADFLAKVITQTRDNVERKRALTDRERELEQLALEEEVNYSDEDNKNNDQSDDEDEIIYNPLKLPLGWDGKPIPFWLWKLNGLGIEYTCQICGNHVYMGRKAFEKHFMEARHVNGLKFLGITASLLFKGITGIDDALKLWEKVKNQGSLLESKRENVIEMEDDEGNVMSEKVYNDLKKQGLL